MKKQTNKKKQQRATGKLVQCQPEIAFEYDIT